MVKLHLGSGTNVLKGWDNLDIEKREGAIYCDLTKDLPYADNSVDLIFSEHVIEHFQKLDGSHLIEECFRVLKPGGGFRIGWPDLARLMKAYMLRQQKYKKYVTPAIETHLFNTWDEMFSDCLFSWEHRYAYTANHMRMILQKTGFKDVHKKQFMKSDYGILQDVRNDPATTYLEATK